MKFFVTLILIFSITVCKAQFTGTYSLRDGGVDVMSSQLAIFPDNEFAIATYSGVITGKWEQKGNNKIILTERKLSDQLFRVYGSVRERPGIVIKLSFDNFDSAEALIAFTNDTLQKPLYQPVFDENSYAGNYTITKTAGTKFVKLVCYPYRNNHMVEDKLVNTAYIYTFQLPKKYTSFNIVYDATAFAKLGPLELKKEGETYLLEGKDIGEKEELTDKIIREVKLYKLEMEKILTNGNSRNSSIPSERILPGKPEILVLPKGKEKALFPPQKSNK